MSLLESLLRPLASLLNETIAESTPARELARELDGTVAAVRVHSSAMAMTFRIDGERIGLAPGAPDDADIAITGSFAALARLALGGDEDAIRDGRVELIGDAEKAQAFQRLLRHARPDPEEQLSRLVGDPAAHAAGSAARGVRRWVADARRTLAANLREYLQEERRDVPNRHEVEHFTQSVNTLRDDVDRLAARIDRLGKPN
jgi:ubiquinone biosynthesis protein UbiJ